MTEPMKNDLMIAWLTALLIGCTCMLAFGQDMTKDAIEMLLEIEARESGPYYSTQVPAVTNGDYITYYHDMAMEYKEDPTIQLKPGEDNEVIFAFDVIKAVQNEDARKAWSEVGEAFQDQPIALKVPVAGFQAVQAVTRTVYEPIEQLGLYSIQSGWHAVGTAIAAYLIGASITGDLDDHIDEIGDLFSSDSDGSGNEHRPTLEPSKLEATDGGKISVSGAPASSLSASAAGEGSEVTVDFADAL